MAESLEYYEAQRYKTDIEISNRKAQNKVISEQIGRLETAYNSLKNVKWNNAQNARLIKDSAKLKNVAGDVKWYGCSKLEFDQIMNYHVSSAANDFYKSIDEMLDEIGRALDTKRGEYNTGIGVLNSLNKTWNYFNGLIRNWVN